MDEPKEAPVAAPITTPSPQVAPQDPPVSQTPLISTPAQTPPQQKPQQMNKLFLIIGTLLCLGVVVVGLLYARSITPAKEEAQVEVTPTVIPTPTPPPNISRIATTSAFAAFSQEIASFSAILESFTLQDSTLAPPILDLELNLIN